MFTLKEMLLIEYLAKMSLKDTSYAKSDDVITHLKSIISKVKSFKKNS